MYKKILFCFIAALCLTNVSFTTASSELHTSIYLGDAFNLERYLINQDIDFPLNEQTSLQNITPQVLNIKSDFTLSGESIGNGVIILENSNNFLTIKIDVVSPIASIKTDVSKLNLLYGEIYHLNYVVLPKSNYYGPINQTLEWQSNNTKVARVKGSYLITTEGAGKATLTGTTLDGSQQITITLTVTSVKDGVTIEVPLNSTSIDAGESRQIQALLGKKDVTDTINWKSDAPSIISIDEHGYMTAHKEGSCQIIAQSTIPHKRDTYTFFVKSRVEKIELNKSLIQLNKIGETYILSAVITPKSANMQPLIQGYTFTSSNEQIATVTSNGVITATGEGIALITVLSNDSLKKDYCTVEVLSNEKITSIDYEPATDIFVKTIDAPVLIGQKVPLSIEVLPKEATNKQLEFKVSRGNNQQIQFIDGRYYFIPNQRGDTDIEIYGDNETEALIEVNVVSPISDLELSLSEDRGSKYNKKLYAGERVELITNISTTGKYSDYDVYPNTLEYSVDDDDILRLESFEGKHYITALKQGTTTVRVNNIEDRYEETLKIEVNAPTKAISSFREVRLPLNIAYRPETFADITPGLVLVEDFSLNRAISTQVEGYFLSETFLDEEINYETIILDQLYKATLSADVSESIVRHELRLSSLSKLKDDVYMGYTRTYNKNLKNRDGQVYKYYKNDGSAIIGLLPGKAVVSLILKGSARKTASTLHFDQNESTFNLRTSNGWRSITQLIKDNEMTGIFSDLLLKDQVSNYIFFNNHREWFKSMPSQELLMATKTIYDKSLPLTLFTDMNKHTTKEELAYIGIYLAEKYDLAKASTTKNVIYYDVVDDAIKQAIALGYVEPGTFNYLGIEDYVNTYDLMNMLNKIKPDHTLTFDTNLSPLSHQDLILILSRL